MRRIPAYLAELLCGVMCCTQAVQGFRDAEYCWAAFSICGWLGWCVIAGMELTEIIETRQQEKLCNR